MFAGDAVALDALVGRMAPAILPGPWLDGLVTDLEYRWMRVLQPDLESARVTRTVSELAGPIQREFASPPPGYAAGRHHSPDVMIAAASLEAIEAGDFELVLGELHATSVTYDSASFTDFAEDPARILGQASLATPGDQIRFVPLHTRAAGNVSGWDYPPPDFFRPTWSYLSLSLIHI